MNVADLTLWQLVDLWWRLWLIELVFVLAFKLAWSTLKGMFS